jgi:hypothetical protein
MAFAASKRARFTFLAAVFALMGALTGSAKASVIEASPSFPPIPLTLTTLGAGCFDPLHVCVASGGMFTLTSATSTFSSAGQDVVADATFTRSLTGLPGSPLANTDIGSSSNNQAGSGTIDVTGMSLSGILDISFPGYGALNGYTMTATLATSPASTGTVSIMPIFTATSGFYTVEYLVTTVIDVNTVLAIEGTGLSETVPIKVEAVPEPPAWMLMVAGFAGLGFAGRRRAARYTRSQGVVS